MPYKVMVGASGTYDQTTSFLTWFRGYGGFFPIPHPLFNRPSLARFVLAVDRAQKYSPQDSGDAVAYAFQILQDVEIRPILKSAVWSAVYDSSNKQIHFRSWNSDRIRTFNLSAFDFSCTTPVKALDIRADLSGDVTNSFEDYTKEIDLVMLKGFLPNGPDDLIDYFAAYPDTTVCTE